MSVTQEIDTDRDQTVAGLRALADLVESGTVPVPSMEAGCFGLTHEDVERIGTVNDVPVKSYDYNGRHWTVTRINVGNVGFHPVDYLALASTPIAEAQS